MQHDRLALTRKWNIKWEKSERTERQARFTLNGTPDRIFPLLCPVLEYAWLPGWKCTMTYSDSGVAEKDCMFYTNEGFGKTALWTCVAHEPDSFVDYLVTTGRDAVMRLNIRLKETGPGKTEVDWRMLFTGLSGLGRFVIRRRFSRTQFETMMRNRERELNWYLEHGRMVEIT
jgi:hypothetical protein